MKVSLPKPRNFLHWGLLLMMVKVLFSASGVLPYSDTMDILLSFGAAIILVVHILLKKYSLKILILYAFITLIALYSTYITKQYGFLITVITCLALRDEEFDTVINFIFKWEFLFFLGHMLYACIISLLPNYSICDIYYGELRYHFGFGHPNMFSIFVFNLILMWIWINYKFVTIKHVGVIFMIAIFFLFFTKTRTAFLDIVIVLLCILCSKKFKASIFLKMIAIWGVPILSLVEYLFCKMYTTGNAVVIFVNSILSGRITLGAYAYHNFGLTMLGQNLELMEVIWDSDWKLNAFTFDCTYTYLMMNQGIVWLVVISLLFLRLAKNGSDRVLIMIIAWSLYAITEVHGLNGFLCFPILLISMLFGNRTNKFAD